MLIGLTGKAGTGKTTAADFLIAQGFVKIGFKDAIVAEITQNFPDLLREIAKHEPFDPTMREKKPLLRALMQNYGTEVRRSEHPWYWLDKWYGEVLYAQREGRNVVCDDVRFLNEAEHIRKVGGKVIRLVRPDLPFTGSHASELEMDSIVPDLTIECAQGDFEGLREAMELQLLDESSDVARAPVS